MILSFRFHKGSSFMDLLLPFCLVYDTRDLKIRGREDLGRLPEVNLTFDTRARVPTAQLIPVLLS